MPNPINVRAVAGNGEPYLTTVKVVNADEFGSGPGGTTNHAVLSNRDAANQHPSKAITHDGQSLDEHLKNLEEKTDSLVGGDDPRLSDSRVPTPHAASHLPDGDDPLHAIGGVTDHSELDGRDKFNQHSSSAIQHGDISLYQHLNDLEGLIHGSKSESLMWFKTALPVSGDWRGLTFGDGRFVTVQNNSANAAYSDDGINWSLVSLPVKADWFALAYGNGRYVATSSSNYAAYSDDGITWSQTTFPASRNWCSVAFGDGRFVVVAHNSMYAAYSDDGITWTQTTLPISANWRYVGYGDGRYVAVVSGSNNAAYSDDGITWTMTDLPCVGSWATVAHADGKFVTASHGQSNDAAYSFDGIEWYPTKMPSVDNWYSIGCGSGLFMAVASNRISAYSNDGIHWSKVAALPETASWMNVVYGDGKFVTITNKEGISAYCKWPIDGYGIDHVDTLNRNQPNQHTTDAITHKGTPLSSYLSDLGASDKEGIYDHQKLTSESRSAADQHPVSAITGLTATLADKADKGEVTTALANKADLVDGKVPAKQLPEVSTVTGVTSVNNKTGDVTIDLADLQEVSSAINKKADATALAGYATTAAMNTALAAKQNRITFSIASGVDTGMTWVDGRAIYVKTVSIGALPDATSKNVSHGISGLQSLIRIEATATTAARTEFLVLPHVGALVDGGYNVELQVTDSSIIVTASIDLSRFTVAYVTLYYTV